MDFWLNSEALKVETDVGPGKSYGYFHRADRNAPSYLPGVLLVFIHGIRSDCRSAFPRLPQYLVGPTAEEPAKLDVDVFGFEFPAKFLRKASIASATTSLGLALEFGFESRYEHVLFVAHSTGGLIVKKLLEADLGRRIAGTAAPDSISERARTIIDLAVPHRGGQRGWTERGRKLAIATQRALYGTAEFLHVASVGAIGWGWNNIFVELSPENPDLLALEDSYVARINECDRRGWKRPASYEILAESDVAATPYEDRLIKFPDSADEQRRRALFVYSDNSPSPEPLPSRGTHSGAYSPRHPSDLIVKVVRSLLDLETHLENYRTAADLAATRETKERIETGDRKISVGELFGDSQNGKAVLSPWPEQAALESCWHGGQAKVLRKLRDRIASAAEQPTRLVVTGGVGIGKTITLRRLASELASEFERDPAPGRPLPFFYPLGRMAFEQQLIKQVQQAGKGDHLATARILTDHWLAWANMRIAESMSAGARRVTLYRSWIEHRLTQRRGVVVFDGLDEFLARYSAVSLGQWRILVDALEQTFPRITSVTGVRSSQRGLTSLAARNEDLLVVAPITPEEAEKILPGVKKLVDRLQNKKLIEFLLTPLILTSLSPRMDFDDPKLLTRAGIITAALEGLLEWNHVQDKKRWPDALALMAWIFFRNFQPVVTLNVVQEKAGEAISAWEQHLRRTGQSEDAASPLPSFRLVADPRSLSEIASRTVFYPPLDDRIAFIHQEWEDFLVPQYLAICIRFGFTDELQHRALAARHFRLAGELLRDFEIQEPLVASVLTQNPEVNARFITGNFVALIGNSRNAITPPAIRRLIGALHQMDAGATDMIGILRYVTLTRLCYRALADDPADRAAPGLRAELLKVLPAYSSRGGEHQVDPVTASDAWCYQSAFSKRFESAPPGAWPGLSENDKGAALGWVCNPNLRDKEPSAHYRSLQLSYLDAQSAMLMEDARTITGVHYLYLLAVAWHDQVHIMQVAEALPGILDDFGEVSQAIARYELVPELKEIFKTCQRLCAPLLRQPA